MSLLDFLFPKKCVSCKKFGEYICPNCFSSISFEVSPKCAVCQKLSIGGFTHPKCKSKLTIDGVSSAVAYKGIIKKLLYQFKYQPYLTDLRKVLGDLMEESLLQNESFINFLKNNPVIVPIPLFSRKLRKRGYNQAEILGKEFSKRFGLKVEYCLKRIKETKPQYGLSQDERAENMKNAFGFQKTLNTQKVRNSDAKTAILIDDVFTTGSTFYEAAKILKKNGFEKVWGIALAQD